MTTRRSGSTTGRRRGGAAFAPYEAASLAEKHRDDVLQTTSPPDKLDIQLRRIDEQARETREEQGVNALFLALGMLHYTEAKESEQVFRAPLVLLPVALARTSAGAGYTLAATDDDYIVNPALAEYLKRTFGITLPELPDPGVHPGRLRPAAVPRRRHGGGEGAAPAGR